MAICLLSVAKSGAPLLVEYALDTLSSIKFDEAYEVFEVFEMKSLGVFDPRKILRINLPPTSVVLLKAVPISSRTRT